MADRMATTMYIGGTVPAEHHDQFLSALAGAVDYKLTDIIAGADPTFQYPTDGDCGLVKPDESAVGLRCSYHYPNALGLHQDEQAWGHFEELEDLCRKLQLPFVRLSDGKYEHLPKVVWGDEQGQRYDLVLDADGDPLIPQSSVINLLDLQRRGLSVAADARAAELTREPPDMLPPFVLTPN